MEELSLARSFGDSLKKETLELASGYAEIGLDTLVGSEALKEVSFFGTIASLYRIGKSIYEWHHLSKLASFMDEIRKGIIDEGERQKYQDKVSSNEKSRNRELEYILIVVDRYINKDKPRLLAKLYLAYLDGVICWEEFTMYAEVIDRLLPFDEKILVTEDDSITVHRNINGEAILRLVALGLMADETNISPYLRQSNGNISLDFEGLSRAVSTDRVYRKTAFGSKLANILR